MKLDEQHDPNAGSGRSEPNHVPAPGPAAQVAGFWLAHEPEERDWQQQTRGGTREDRMLTRINTIRPPLIAVLHYHSPAAAAAEAEAALVEVLLADAAAAGHSAAMSRFLLRSESVASSKIEAIWAGAEDYARAVAGSRANASATSMVAATEAMTSLVDRVGQEGFSLETILGAHRLLMREDRHEARFAGRVRDMQNWIGGSDFSPRGALHIPPAPELVPELLEDLIAYLQRDDIPVITQAAIGHAQFESIHPFTDGNGRIGRAIVAAVFRRRGITRNTVVPLANGILARRDAYFDALGRYRAGDPSAIIAMFARSVHVGALEVRTTIGLITGMPATWIEQTKARAGSTLERLIHAFYEHPTLNSVEISRLSGAGTSQTSVALARLEEAGIIAEITGRTRDRAWVATDLIAELDDLDNRIQSEMRGQPLQ